MRRKLLTTVLLVIFLAGCATVRKGQDMQIQQLHSRINDLEIELQRKDQEIDSLENELERRQGRLASINKQEDGKAMQMSARQIQAALKNAGFYQGQIDGKMGEKTKKAITAFQKAKGLKADGIVGKRTLVELNRYLKR